MKLTLAILAFVAALLTGGCFDAQQLVREAAGAAVEKAIPMMKDSAIEAAGKGQEKLEKLLREKIEEKGGGPIPEGTGIAGLLALYALAEGRKFMRDRAAKNGNGK